MGISTAGRLPIIHQKAHLNVHLWMQDNFSWAI
jgi:hypothetical protein